MNENKHESYFCQIPSIMLDDPEIDDGTAILYARITSLAHKEGYCYASDQYLADLTKTSLRTLQRRMLTLQLKGWLVRETKRNGMFWERKIYVKFDRAQEASPMAEFLDKKDIEKEIYKKKDK